MPNPGGSIQHPNLSASKTLWVASELFSSFGTKRCSYPQMDVIHNLSELAAVDPPVTLAAIRFSDSMGALLHSATLANLPPLPPALQYICWDVQGRRQLFRIERTISDGQEVRYGLECDAIKGFVNANRDGQRLGGWSTRWVGTTVFDHFAEEEGQF